jgi:hypothetical protein
MDGQVAYELAVDAYVYLYPLVLMDVTRAQATNVEHGGQLPMRAPTDTFVHVPAFPPAEFRDVVRPNFDTLYSVVWLDLSEEPRIVSVPAAGDNYYLLPLYDMWGEVFACPGVRTTGRDAITIAICAPGWSGTLPAGIRRYDAPTPTVWIIGRTEASVATYDKVRAFQAGMTVTPLSVWPAAAAPAAGRIDPAIDQVTPPLRTVFAMDAATYFARAIALLGIHPPHAMDYPILDRMAAAGLEAGKPFDLAAASPEMQAAFAKAVPDAQARITQAQRRFGTRANGWQMNVDVMGNYGTHYLKRATVELVGLGANLPEDAVYPLVFVDSDGHPFDGANGARYVWHMSKEQLPPVRAFWSLTLYDNEGFQVANELDRFAIGDRDSLAFNADGSLDIVISHERPAEGTSNWLPAPAGPFNLTARLYWPRPEALDGRWVPPAVVRTA